jgi:hypothetical protein
MVLPQTKLLTKIRRVRESTFDVLAIGVCEGNKCAESAPGIEEDPEHGNRSALLMRHGSEQNVSQPQCVRRPFDLLGNHDGALYEPQESATKTQQSSGGHHESTVAAIGVVQKRASVQRVDPF